MTRKLLSHKQMSKAARAMYGESIDRGSGAKPAWIKEIFEDARKAAFISDSEYGCCKWPDRHLALVEYIMRSSYMPSQSTAIKLAREIYNVRHLNIPPGLSYPSTGPSTGPTRLFCQDYPQLYADLLALSKEFDISSSTGCGSMSFTTKDDIKLTDELGRVRNMGRYSIVFPRSKEWRNYRIVSPSGQAHHIKRHLCHPHVERSKLCEGDASRPLNTFHSANALYEFVCTIRTTLSTYNPSSPYARLGSWSGVVCQFCENTVSEGLTNGELRKCDSCEVGVCNECNFRCPTCDSFVCPICKPREAFFSGDDTRNCCASCRSTCPGCRKSYHKAYLSLCKMKCTNSGYCRSCLTHEFSSWEGTGINLDWLENDDNKKFGLFWPGYPLPYHASPSCRNCALVYTVICRQIMDVVYPGSIADMLNSGLGCPSSYSDNRQSDSHLDNTYANTLDTITSEAVRHVLSLREAEAEVSSTPLL